MQVMQQLEKINIVHRDIKAENILINEAKDELKLIDFGFSRIFEEGKMMKTACGSPNYSAPEILAKQSYDPIKADIWSAGIVLYLMLCGKKLLILKERFLT